MDSEQEILRANSLYHIYESNAEDGNVVALRGLSMTMYEGEAVAVVGPSGSGKTTALRILSGLEKPSGGQVYIDEENVTDVLPKYRDISMVFQSYALYPCLLYTSPSPRDRG